MPGISAEQSPVGEGSAVEAETVEDVATIPLTVAAEAAESAVVEASGVIVANADEGAVPNTFLFPSQGSDTSFTPASNDPFLDVDMGPGQHLLLQEFNIMAAEENPDQQFLDIDQVLKCAKAHSGPIPLQDSPEAGPVDAAEASAHQRLAIELYAEHHGKAVETVTLEEVMESLALNCSVWCVCVCIFFGRVDS
jgi:hypothetical protein